MDNWKDKARKYHAMATNAMVKQEPGICAELKEAISSSTEELGQVRAQNVQHWEEHSRLFEELQTSAILIHELQEQVTKLSIEIQVSRPSHNLSGNGRAATSRDTGVTNRVSRPSP